VQTRGRVTRSLFLALAFLVFAASGRANSFSAVFVYGDSLSDNGNLFNAVGQPGPPYYNGRVSNGPVTVEYLAAILNAPLYDWAWAGATSGVGNQLDGGTQTSLGFLNLLPIPILDGGQVVFQIAEWVRGRPLSERIYLVGQQAGLLLLVLLMGVALFNDISGIAARP